MGTNPKGCFLGGIRRRGLVFFFEAWRWDFLIFQGIILLVMWGRVCGGSGWVCFFLVFFSFVIWWLNEDFFSRKYFIKINIFLGEWKNFNTKFNIKNLTERTKNILFKIEHLIHLTRIGEKMSFDFFVCLNFFTYMIKKLMFKNNNNNIFEWNENSG